MKVFLIGCGDIARHHGRAVVRLGGQVIGGFDVSEANARLVADEFNCPICKYEEIESYMPGCDYAVISTPPTKRLDYVEMVLRHHVPLYLEKPVSVTMEDAHKLKELAERYGGRIMVGFAHYYRPAYQKMLEMVKSGMFGEPVDIAFSRLSPGFRFPREKSGRLLAHRPRPRLRHDRRERQPRLEAHHRHGRRLRHYQLQLHRHSLGCA